MTTRIHPGNPGELREVGVGRDYGEPVLARERGEVSVWDQVSRWQASLDDLAENLLVPGAGGRGPEPSWLAAIASLRFAPRHPLRRPAASTCADW